MAEKDLTEKILLSYDDVFADIVNGLVFEGKERVKPSSLSDKIVHNQYKADNDTLHEEERDIFKLWEECGIEIALCGLENQTNPFRFMPARIIGYDGASYREQLLDTDRKKLLPVITLVLYFGMDHWNAPKNLKELFGEYPEELERYINDYKIHVFEIAWFSDEEIARFTGDFRIVANFFAKKRRNGGNYVPDDPQEIEHVDAVLKLLSVMSGDDSYRNLKISGEGRKISMCDVAQNLIAQGVAQGIVQGKAEGIAQGKAEEHRANIEKLANNYLTTQAAKTKEEAVKMAEAILGKE